MLENEYVIEVSGAPGTCWFAGFDDEAEPGDQLQTTSDETMAARYGSFSEARDELCVLTEKYPQRQFRISTIEPLASRADDDYQGPSF